MILLRPVDKRFRITQRFGENPEDYPKTNGHNGIDIGLPEGNPVRAAANGTVERAELDTETAQNPKRGYGFHVRILHPDGTRTLYAHFREQGLLVSTGQNVRMGDVIGRSGSTGMSTGPHLHFELRLGPSVLTGRNPEPLLVDEIPPDPILKPDNDLKLIKGLVPGGGLFDVTITPEGDGLRIRGGPSTRNAILRSLRPGDRLKVFGLVGGDVWLRVQEGFIKFDPNWVKIE